MMIELARTQRSPARLNMLVYAVVLCAGAAAGQAASAAPVIYPAKGQSAKQQDKDRYECHDWARTQSGFDPTNTAQVATAAPVQSRSTTDGMVRGAIGGAAVAELTHRDAGTGAAAGALGAGLIGRAKERQTAMAQQQAARGQQRAIYERGFAACLDARGYIVR